LNPLPPLPPRAASARPNPHAARRRPAPSHPRPRRPSRPALSRPAAGRPTPRSPPAAPRSA